jgi:hypothetical protein
MFLLFSLIWRRKKEAESKVCFVGLIVLLAFYFYRGAEARAGRFARCCKAARV